MSSGEPSTDPSTTDVVDFQCTECTFNVVGSSADVEVARRTHRHANLSLVVLDGAGRERLRKTYFAEPLSFSHLDTSGLPQPYPRFYAAAVALAALLVTAASAFFSRWLVDTRYPSMGGWLHGVFMLMIVAGVVYTLVRYENDRRAANIRRLQVVSECNHHIRNAVQVLIARNELQDAPPGIGREITDAVHRIELTLSEVFPKIL